MSHHPDSDQLLRYLSAELPDVERDAVEAHVGECFACETAMSRLVQVERVSHAAAVALPAPRRASWFVRLGAFFAVAVPVVAAVALVVSPGPPPPYTLRATASVASLSGDAHRDAVGTHEAPMVGSEGNGCTVDLGGVVAGTDVSVALTPDTGAAGAVRAWAYSGLAAVGESPPGQGTLQLRFPTDALARGPVDVIVAVTAPDAARLTELRAGATLADVQRCVVTGTVAGP